MVTIGQLYARPFPDLFGDSIFLHYRAEDCDDPVENSILAKSSVLNAALSIEAAANCCIDRLKADPDRLKGYAVKLRRVKAGDTIEAIDPARWSPLDKYSLLCLAGTGEKLKRGKKPVQQARELIELRHAYVHPQIRPREVIEIPLYMEIGPGGHFYGEFSNAPTNDERSNMLKIPLNSWLLRSEHSRKALIATIEFFNYFFCDLLKFDATQTANFIFNIGPSNERPYALKYQEELFRTIEDRLSIVPRFLLVTAPPKRMQQP